MTDSHSAAMMARHAELDRQLVREQRRAAPDTTLVALLKKQKLKLKEALARLT
jgi:hypothetical protein